MNDKELKALKAQGPLTKDDEPVDLTQVAPEGPVTERKPITGWGSHRWSGWPGAWCLDCGIDDPVEAMMNDPDHVIDYEEMPDGSIVDKSYFATPEAEARWKEACEYSCPEPGSNRHNPYFKPDGEVDPIELPEETTLTVSITPKGIQFTEGETDAASKKA